MKHKVFLNVTGGFPIQTLPNELETIKSWGFDGAELMLDAFPLIISGRANMPFVRHLRRILGGHDMRFSAHIGVGLDLRSRDNLSMNVNVLRASVDVCAELGINLLNLHFEQDSGDSAIEAQFIGLHADAADYAFEREVSLFIENIEIEHYKPALEAVKAIGRPNLRMNLDVGHLYISSRYYGYSFEDAVTECAPFVGHCHLNDNTGISEPMRLENFDLYRCLPMGNRIAFGRGDIHMPPLYCDVPIPFAISELKKAGFSGIFVCEYQSRLFAPFNADICAAVRRLIEG